MSQAFTHINYPNNRIPCCRCGVHFPVKAFQLKPVIRCPHCQAAYQEDNEKDVRKFDIRQAAFWLYFVTLFVLFNSVGSDIVQWLSPWLGETTAKLILTLVFGGTYYWLGARWWPTPIRAFKPIQNPEEIEWFQPMPMSLKSKMLLVGILLGMVLLAVVLANIPRPGA